eukprot:860671-Pelagomonas_calceolata.AAC.1
MKPILTRVTRERASLAVRMWKLAKQGIKSVSGSWAKLTQLTAIAIEKNMFLFLDFSRSTLITNI